MNLHVLHFSYLTYFLLFTIDNGKFILYCPRPDAFLFFWNYNSNKHLPKISQSLMNLHALHFFYLNLSSLILHRQWKVHPMLSKAGWSMHLFALLWIVSFWWSQFTNMLHQCISSHQNINASSDNVTKLSKLLVSW